MAYGPNDLQFYQMNEWVDKLGEKILYVINNRNFDNNKKCSMLLLKLNAISLQYGNCEINII